MIEDSQLSECESDEDACTLDEIFSACNEAGVSFQRVRQESRKLLSGQSSVMVNGSIAQGKLLCNYQRLPNTSNEDLSMRVCQDSSEGHLPSLSSVKSNCNALLGEGKEAISVEEDQEVLSIFSINDGVQNLPGEETNSSLSVSVGVSTLEVPDHAVKPSSESNEPGNVSSAQGFNEAQVNLQEFAGDPKRKRKKKADRTQWIREIAKNKRMRGEEYMGSETVDYNQNTKERKRKFCTKLKPGKSMGPTCISKKCAKSSRRLCAKFSQTEREQLFETFWKQMDIGEKKEHVSTLVDCCKPRQRRGKSSESNRNDTYLYHLKKDGIRLQVCKQMFLNTLGIGDKQLRAYRIRKPPATGAELSRPVSVKVENARQYLEDLPKMPSHYCRKDTTKMYLEPFFQSQRQLHKEYVKICKQKDQEYVSWGTFHKLFDEMNIGLFQPRKDRCDLCVAHDNHQIPDEEWIVHRSLYEAVKAEQANDKMEACRGTCHVVCVDVQAVQICPMLNASALYYRTKLNIHNYTVFDVRTRDVVCYLFDETQGDLSGSIFATCLVNYLERFTDGKPIIVYSDGCGNQNRNTMLSNALLDLAIRNTVCITQKFLYKGHTQMEVDSVHSAIERKLKNRQIYLPSDYADICMEAREKSPGPYKVECLTYSFFKNYSIPSLQWYTSIRPGNKTGDKCVTDIRQLLYKSSGEIEYRLKIGDDWTALPRSPASLTNPQFPSLFEHRLPITKRKYKDLQDLLHVLPTASHEFYNKLPVK